MTLVHETVDADGVLTRFPLPFAYAERWAAALDYRLVAMGDTLALYAPKGALSHKTYYTPLIEAQQTFVTVRTPVSTFTLYFQIEPLKGGASCDVGMRGEPFPEDALQELMLAVRDLPYSAQAIEKLIDKSDWLDANPMYRGLPGVAGRHESPGQSAADVGRPLDW